MASLIASLKWDEQRYGLEYDLDLFNVRFLICFSPYRVRCEIANHTHTHSLTLLPAL
jgi:aminopeptidase N